MVQKDGRIILGYRRLEEWFYQDLKRMSQWIEEATFAWLNLLFRGSENWYRRMEELFQGTEGWKNGSIEKEKVQMVGRSNIWLAKRMEA